MNPQHHPNRQRPPAASQPPAADVGSGRPADSSAGESLSLPAGDHRRLGAELGLFASDPLLPPGMPLWLPAGAAIRAALERYIVDAEAAAGYEHVYTPPLGRQELYEISGHWEHYAEDMFPPMPSAGGNIVLRPMNCPHHILAYRAQPRSWRALPVRFAELGAMFRDERSGVVSGLSRVRAMTLNDAHIFAREDDIADEVAAVLALIQVAYRDLGLTGRYRLSLRGPGAKYVAGNEMWDHAESALRDALGRAGLDFDEQVGEAAFYGPKIDVQVAGLSGREETFSTVQLDFHLPAQFDLSYAGPSGPRRPVMIHRSIISTMERCVALLLEAHGGNLPAWLAPKQLVVLPVRSDDPAQLEAALTVVSAARANGLRTELDASADPLGARIRRSRQRRVPWRAVIGEREAASGLVAVSCRDGQHRPAEPAEVFLAHAQAILGQRATRSL